MFTYQLASSSKQNCGVYVNRNFVIIGGRKIVIKHVTCFGLYSYHPFWVVGLVLLLAGIATAIFGGVEYESRLYVLAVILAVTGIVLMCIKKAVLYIHTSCDADKTWITGAKNVLSLIYDDIEAQIVADSILAPTPEQPAVTEEN